MGRKAVTMKLKESKTDRVNMFKKRGSNLKKKAMELSTLCGIDMCMIMFSETGAVETWPENDPEKIHAVIESYKTNNDKTCKNTTIEDNIHARIKTKQEELAKVKNAILEAKSPTSGDIYQSLPEENRREIANSLTAKIEEVQQKIHDIKAFSAYDFANNYLDLVPLNNDYAIQDQNMTYCNTTCYNNVPSEIYSTAPTSTSLQHPAGQYVQLLYGGDDFHFPATSPPAEPEQWVDYQCGDVRACYDQFQIGEFGELVEPPYLLQME